MRRKCPNCGKMPDIPEAGGYCNHCGTYIEGRGPSGQKPATKGIAEYCPWEEMDKIGFFRALWETLSGVLFKPTEFFSRMPVVDGIGRPLLFGLLAGCVGGIVSTLWRASMAFPPYWLPRFPGWEEIPYQSFWPYWISGSVFLIIMIFLTPLFVLAGMFIWAGIMHLCLLILGGAQKGFEATFRVVAYSEATSIFQIIPFCGAFISLPWFIIVQIIGFKEAHQISGGKATGAVFLPLIFCCGLLFAVAIILGLAGLSGVLPELFH